VASCWIFYTNDSVYWMISAQDRDKWQAVLKIVMNIGLSKFLRISWTAAKLSVSQEGLCSLQLATSLRMAETVKHHTIHSRLSSLRIIPALQ